MGVAVVYCDAYWNGPCPFLDDPIVPMTERFAERSLRGAVFGSAKRGGIPPKPALREAARRAVWDGVGRLPHNTLRKLLVGREPP